ncbi:MAG TPA: HAD-IIIC family phosphatase, partial [Crenalkalicoccus sp.]|nr:HAD-IIIC family phosphatase [Crenalkalicoccus sp.]
ALRGAAPGGGAWVEAASLAETALDFARTNALAEALERVFGTEAPPGLGTAPERLAVLGSSTLAHLLGAIRVAALRRGIALTAREGGYGQAMQELLDPRSWLAAFRPTTVLLAFDARRLARGASPAMTEAEAEAALDAACDELRQCWRLARESGARVLQQTALPCLPPLLGANEHRLPGSPAGFLARLNARLPVLTEAEGVDLVALDARAALDGLAAWHDPALWHRAKQEVRPQAAPLYGELVARVLAARQGRSRKCLVLDCDNTLWGGVIGDDGLEGIVLGEGSAEGEAFLAVQRHALALSERGVILAVCSKNEERVAMAAFERHPEMLLRPRQIAAFAANWTDKPANLRAIAEELSIGLDSLVFLDDNPFERALVRRELPMVAVPELPEDPALWPRTLADAGYFEGVAVTAEDRARAAQYQGNRDRATLRAQATDLGAYLRELEMRLLWSRFDRAGLPRIVQLINKTNQFNLTTRRYTDAEAVAVAEDPAAFGLQLRMLDRFGDNGVIGIVIGRRQGDAVRLDTWLMSCRVLGRQVEEATLNLVVEQARALGAARLIGEYRPTPKNGMVAEHYPRLGFAPLASDGDAMLHVLELAGYVPRETAIRLEAA